jgi:hypothetical protein
MYHTLFFILYLQFIQFKLIKSALNTTNSDFFSQKSRRLADKIPSNSDAGAHLNHKNGIVAKSSLYQWHEKRSELRRAKLEQFVAKIELTKTPEPFAPEPWSTPHGTESGLQAVFTVAMSETYMRRDARNFVGTLRRTGYTGDIVVAVVRKSMQPFLDTLKEYKCTVYTIQAECTGPVTGHRVCHLKGETSDTKFSINMLRYHLYRWWTMRYAADTQILLADFRDVFFQSNPFKYHPKEWNSHGLVVFQEAHPLKTIGRCPFNSNWVRNCYGSRTLIQISNEPVSCSGTTMGNRDGILAYVYLMTQQLNPKVRYGKESQETNAGCVTMGMDQGFHNWLVYGGALEKLMSLKIYQQGEGPVSTVGAFFPGRSALIKRNLTEWRVLRGSLSDKYFSNWNGEPSPVVHQADRFQDKDLKPDYSNHLRSFQGLYV